MRRLKRSETEECSTPPILGCGTYFSHTERSDQDLRKPGGEKKESLRKPLRGHVSLQLTENLKMRDWP